jgi:hypothetical protein
VPTFGPEGVDANSSSSTTTVVKWGEVPRDHRNEQIEGYKVFYGSAATSRTPILHKIIAGNLKDISDIIFKYWLVQGKNMIILITRFRLSMNFSLFID